MTGAVDQQRAAEAFHGAWRWLASSLPTGMLAEHDGIAVLATGLPDRTLNPAFVVGLPRDPHDAVGRAAAARASLPAPSTGLDLPEGRHPQVERALRDVGYVERVRRPGMVLEPAAMVRPAHPSGLDLRRVTSQADWRGYVDVQVGVFGLDPGVAAEFPPYDVLGAPDMRLVVGSVSDEVVCTAAVFVTGGVAGLYAVATPAAVRGRGFGSAATGFAVDAAAALGARLVALQSTEDGYLVYRRLGFRDTGDWVVWVDPSVE